MNAVSYSQLSEPTRAEIEAQCEPVEYSGKELKRKLRDDDKVLFFEQRRQAMAPQRKK
jgi:hypothetical protein